MRIIKLFSTIIILALTAALASCEGKRSSNSDTETNQQETSENIVPDSAEIENTIPPMEIPQLRREDSILQSLGMVKISDSLPDIIIDMKYATDDNFLGFDFYKGFKEAYIQPECLKKLAVARKLLKEQDSTLTFVVFDAARSIESQQLMWDSIDVPQSRKHWYVAVPEKGSIHNYGMALDISIATQDGDYLDMGTHFDYFGELAYPSNTDKYHNDGTLSDEQYENRKLLMRIMQQAGFFVSKTEWWHYNASSLNRAKDTYNIYSTKTEF